MNHVCVLQNRYRRKTAYLYNRNSSYTTQQNTLYFNWSNKAGTNITSSVVSSAANVRYSVLFKFGASEKKIAKENIAGRGNKAYEKKRRGKNSMKKVKDKNRRKKGIKPKINEKLK